MDPGTRVSGFHCVELNLNIQKILFEGILYLYYRLDYVCIVYSTYIHIYIIIYNQKRFYNKETIHFTID